VFRTILVPIDGSDPSVRAVTAAMDLARATGAEIVLLHVREHELTWATDIDVETEPEAIELVESYVRLLKDAELPVRGEVLRSPHGQVARAILDVARSEAADVIVIATHGYSVWARLLLGSVTTKVVHLATCPVLVVR